MGGKQINGIIVIVLTHTNGMGWAGGINGLICRFESDHL